MQPQAGFGTPQEEIDRLYDYMVPQMKCDDMKYIGSLAKNGEFQDGAYAGCLSPGFWPAKGEPCLGYSFGIDYEWKFDDGLEALGCQGLSYTRNLKIQNLWYTSRVFHREGQKFLITEQK